MSTPLVDSILETTPPSVLLRAVAARMLELADAATPDRWLHHCMGSDCCQVVREAGIRERDRLHVARFGEKRELRHDHADAAYVTAMQPAVARATAAMLAEVADEISAVPAGCFAASSPAPALVVARAFMDATGWRPEFEFTEASG